MMRIMALVALLSGLFLLGCTIAPKNTVVVPTFDCVSIQKEIEQNCNVELEMRPRQSTPNICDYLTKDKKYEYYFNVLPLDKYYSGINDLKKVLNNESISYEELNIEKGAVFLNVSPLPGQSSQVNFMLYVFDDNNQYIVQANSRFGPQDEEHCVSKAGVLRVSNFRAVNGTFSYNPYGMMK
ncbi:MAG: hypothetical protein NT157_01670 [Candidatus Micrarchaeota archaeon]|nr:hypothetical protein [Candidatus Micrarchaeota archaeon]